MSNLLLRDARPIDVPALAELFRQLGYDADEEALGPRVSACADPSTRILVAEMARRVCGVVVVHVLDPVHVAGRWGLVSALVVEASLRGSGVGARLLAAAEGHAWEQGCSQVELSSSMRRTAAHAFYEREGYEEVRKRYLKRRSVG